MECENKETTTLNWSQQGQVLKETVYEKAEWIFMTKDIVQWRVLANKLMNFRFMVPCIVLQYV
jgi:hypothetical protein